MGTQKTPLSSEATCHSLTPQDNTIHYKKAFDRIPPHQFARIHSPHRTDSSIAPRSQLSVELLRTQFEPVSSPEHSVGSSPLLDSSTMTSNYMTELFYGKPEPVWVINNRRRNMDPYYVPGMAPVAPGYSRGTSLLPDVTVKTPLYSMADVARIKHILGAEGVFNVVCDIPEQSVTVSSSLSPRVIVGLIRQAMGSAHIVNYVDPLQPTFVAPQERARYYDDSYSYDAGYAPSAYSLPYNGRPRAYDNEFRPAYRYGRSYY